MGAQGLKVWLLPVLQDLPTSWFPGPENLPQLPVRCWSASARLVLLHILHLLGWVLYL